MLLPPKARRALLALVVLLGTLAAGGAGAFETIARQALLVDAATGAVLFEKNADQTMLPASMSKMMTVYMVFERIKKGQIKLDDTFVVSDRAWREGGSASGGSTMFLKPSERVTVQDLLRGVIIQSGNDASIVLAEGIAGTEQAFAEQTMQHLRELGIRNTTFRNASGLPDPTHVTTARDLARIAELTIKNFPEFYALYGEREFTYNGIRQGNRNPLLYRSVGADGLKTGHTTASGFGLTASAVRGDRRLILVIHGLPNMQVRADEAERLLDYGFQTFENYRLFKAGEEVAQADLWYGAVDRVPLVGATDLVVTLPRAARPNIKVTVNYTGPIPAPVKKGDQVAVLRVTGPEMKTIEHPLVAGADVERLGIFGRVMFAVRHLVGTVTN
jgi:D-alanyl-D-alanine carboxypeptidase (penicillin-binding protein 5/6)